jgi:hypothetical protein
MPVTGYNILVPIYKKVNKDFFKKWSLEMAYVLGFFAADGYITVNKRGGHFFCFQIKEKDILLKFRKLLGSEHKIAVRNNSFGKTYRWQVGSKEMCQDLDNLGFGQKKTFRLVIPKMPHSCLPHFIRGYFDGDGNIWLGLKHKNRAKSLLSLQTSFTSCSVGFLESLQKNLSMYGLGRGSLHGLKNKDASRLSYSTKDSLKLYNLMYSCYSVEDLYLSKKRRVFEKFVKMQR